MEYSQVFLVLVLSVLAAYVINELIRFGHFSVVYNHLPGNCTLFNMDGSEDMVLFPNNHVVISSGLFLYGIFDEKEKLPAGIFLLDLNSKHPQLVNLTFEGFPASEIPTKFAPHGMGSWTRNDGSMLLYFVNHRKTGDTVESFTYLPSKQTLVYRKTFRDRLFSNLNDLVLVDEDRFYVTVDRYFTNKILRSIETCLQFSLAYVLYCGEGGVGIASETLKYPNGIARSNDGRFVFVNELLKGQVIAYTRNGDNTLQRAQELPLQPANDNIFVDPTNGHLWVGILVNSLQVSRHFHNRQVPIKSKILHIKVDQRAELPFDNVSIEEVFSSNAEDGVVGAVTGCVHFQGRLVVGTIMGDMMLCDAPYIRYN